MKTLSAACFTALAGLATFATPASGDARNPGSLLIFPEYDHGPGRNTFITVTNSSPDAGIFVHYWYISGVPGTLCNPSNRVEPLTASDTITVLTHPHSGQPPTGTRYKGFLYVYAENAAGVPVSFNFLIGDEIVVDGTNALQYAVTPVVYRAIGGTGQSTNIDGDNVRDLNDVEYEGSPDRILIPRFMGQSGTHQSELVLISLTGGANFSNIVDFLLFNDNEQIFSAQHEFTCWQKLSLSSISAMFDNSFLHNSTNDASNEIIGASAYEAGWLMIDGNVAQSTARMFVDPTILAVLVETAGTGANRVGAEIPFANGKQLNGDLLPVGVFGDSN